MFFVWFCCCFSLGKLHCTKNLFPHRYKIPIIEDISLLLNNYEYLIIILPLRDNISLNSDPKLKKGSFENAITDT